MWNRSQERLPRAELEKLQLLKLNSLLERLHHSSPFYRDRFKAEGLADFRELRKLSDLNRYRFTSKADLRDQYPLGMNIAPPNKALARIHASSGTRGKPTIVAYTKKDLETFSEACARSLSCAGVKAGDILHNAYGYGLFTGGLGIHYGAEKLGATVVPAGGGRTQQQAMLIADLGAKVLCSTPSYALNIHAAMTDLGIDINHLPLSIGIFGAEPWTEPMRHSLQEKLSIKAVDIYGLSEIIGPGVSVECLEEQNGLHLWEDLFFPEIIDPESLEPLPPGSEGELVISTLDKESMPLLRYRTGDVSALSYAPCKCGRSMVRMARLRGRLDDMLIVRGVNVYPSEIENILLKVAELAPHYQLVLSRDKALDELAIHVELKEELHAIHPELIEGNLSVQVRELLKDRLGITAKVELLAPKSIERSEGKASRLKDMRFEGRN